MSVVRTSKGGAVGVLKQSVLVAALAIGVTIAGTAAGALIVAPAVSHVAQAGWHVSMPTIVMPHVALPHLVGPPMRLPTSLSGAFNAGNMTFRFALPAFVTLLAIVAMVCVIRMRKRAKVQLRRDTQPLRVEGRPDRTPRAVQALAASGTSPSEISWRTGLAVDAIALLLAISTVPRQLQPPSAQFAE